MINIILAVDKNCGIGKNNKLPWHIVEEIKIFKEKTMNSVIIGGRKTIESLPTLTGRTIFCISRNFKTLNTNKNIAFLFMSIEDAINEAISMKKQIYIIGGGEIMRPHCSTSDRTFSLWGLTSRYAMPMRRISAASV